MKSIAVTGANGLVGSQLCQYFSSHGWRVRPLVRRPGPDEFLCNLPGEIDPAGLADLDVLVHAAYPTLETDPARAQETNEEGTARLLQLSREAKVGRFVLISSISADENAPAVYGRTKVAVERMLDPARDLILRPGLVLAAEGDGLFQRMRDMIARLPAIPLFGGGREVLQTVHATDLCEALLRALERSITGTLSIAERSGPTYREFLGEIASRLGRRTVFVPIPYAPSLFALRVVEALGLRLPVSSENLRGLRALRAFDVSADLERIGLEPRSAGESLADVLR